MSQILYLPAAARTPMPWKNGGGVTREVARDPQSEGTSSFKWRVSIAEVAQAGPFSRFAGYRRMISVIDGRGMQLDVAGSGVTMLRPYEPFEFDGDVAVDAILPLGPVSDLNVVFQSSAVRASMRFLTQEMQWHAKSNHRVLLINVGEEPMVFFSRRRSLELARFDGVLLADGDASVSSEEIHYAAIEMEF